MVFLASGVGRKAPDSRCTIPASSSIFMCLRSPGSVIFRLYWLSSFLAMSERDIISYCSSSFIISTLILFSKARRSFQKSASGFGLFNVETFCR